MKFRGFLATIAAAMVCCVTLGCPPAENNENVPVDVDVAEPADDAAVDSAATAAPAPATPPEDVNEVEE